MPRLPTCLFFSLHCHAHQDSVICRGVLKTKGGGLRDHFVAKKERVSVRPRTWDSQFPMLKEVMGATNVAAGKRIDWALPPDEYIGDLEKQISWAIGQVTVLGAYTFR